MLPLEFSKSNPFVEFHFEYRETGAFPKDVKQQQINKWKE